MPDTPPSEPRLPPHTADTDVLLFDELETAEPRWLPESEPVVGTVLDLGKAGAYTLEQRLGRGGMGEVYKARQVGAKGFSQLVAIKQLRPGWREWEEQSFVDEARILSRLHHENIARVYGFFELEGDPYLVMEYIEGHSLHALLDLARRKGHRFSESVACAVMAEVADALDYAHHVEDHAGRPLHIVHRDVSPTNILIAKTGRVVLVDFGVALSKQEGRVVTRTGSTIIKGKAPYLSPEQVKHLPLDARSDLFSVGTILVELLTGEAPFGWTADFTTLKRIAAVTPEYVASLLPGVSEPLRALCQKLLTLHPDQRFATGREVAMALRHHAGLGEGPRSIQADVERLQALPDLKASVAEVARVLPHVRRAVAVAGAVMLGTLVFASWYVPRHAGPIPCASPPQGPSTASLPRPPDPPPASPLVGQTAMEDSTPAVARVDKKTRVPPNVIAPPAVRRTEASADPDEVTSSLRSRLVKAMDESNMPDHAVAALLVSDRADLTSFVRSTSRRADSGVRKAAIEVFVSPDEDEPMVAVVMNMKNPRDAASWEPTEARVKAQRAPAAMGEPVLSGRPVPAAVRSIPARIVPGQSARIAVVFQRNDVGLDTEPVDIEILREGKWEFELTLQPSDLVASKTDEP